jgi:hypothetical protein
MHTAKKEKKYKKEKPRSSDLFPEIAALTPPRQHQKSTFSKSDASKKETMHKHRRRPIMDLRISPRRKSSLSKQCIQQGHCHTQPIKATPSIFTLKGKTLDFSCALAPTYMPLL